MVEQHNNMCGEAQLLAQTRPAVAQTRPAVAQTRPAVAQARPAVAQTRQVSPFHHGPTRIYIVNCITVYL